MPQFIVKYSEQQEEAKTDIDQALQEAQAVLDSGKATTVTITVGQYFLTIQKTA